MVPDKQLGNVIILTPSDSMPNAATLREAKFLILRGAGVFSITLPSLGAGNYKALTVVNETTDPINIANTTVPARSSITVSFTGTVWF